MRDGLEYSVLEAHFPSHPLRLGPPLELGYLRHQKDFEALLRQYFREKNVFPLIH